jgi:hypothetical protein
MSPHPLPTPNWTNQSDHIQRKFLRHGPYTHLHIRSPTPDTIEWTFTFADLGMCHVLESASTLTTTPNSPTHLCVDGEVCGSEESALEAVFGRGRFEACVRGVYAELGVENDLQ